MYHKFICYGKHIEQYLSWSSQNKRRFAWFTDQNYESQSRIFLYTWKTKKKPEETEQILHEFIDYDMKLYKQLA